MDYFCPWVKPLGLNDLGHLHCVSDALVAMTEWICF